ncbi:DUF998 domain-containing protein [Micromonospora musae]|uniref:DUF998 domain-containing protein n=1 Tax=Micromonospora musae TaxID=1894970 RepID=UPI0033D0F2B0
MSAATGPVSSAEAPATNRVLALATLAGAALFTVAWFVLGFFNTGYRLEGDWIPSSPISQPLSGLGMGSTGPYMNAAFVLSGLLLLVGLIGVFRTMPPGHRPAARRLCAAGLALSPVGLVVAGIFTIEHDLPHLAGFGLIALTPVLTFALAGAFLRGIPAWRRLGTLLMVLGSPLTLLTAFMYLASFDEASTAAGEGIAGLLSRILGLTVHGWFAAMGWHAFRQTTPVRSDS